MEWNDKPKIVVPVEILNVCQAIQSKLPGMEFSILVKPKEIRPYIIVLSTDYITPKQEVSASGIDYDSEEMLKLINSGYNVVIHSHHDMGCGFSETDKQQLHQGNLLASILFTQNKFKEAVILVKSELFGIAEIKAEVEVKYPEVDISNISIKREPKLQDVKSKSYYDCFNFLDIENYNFEICPICGTVIDLETDKECPYCGFKPNKS